MEHRACLFFLDYKKDKDKKGVQVLFAKKRGSGISQYCRMKPVTADYFPFLVMEDEAVMVQVAVQVAVKVVVKMVVKMAVKMAVKKMAVKGGGERWW